MKIALLRNIRSVFRPDSRWRALFLSLLMSTIGYGLYKGVFDNYMAEVAQMNELDRGVTEFFRELPGLLLVLVLAVFYRASAEKMYKWSMVIMAVGMALQAWIAPQKMAIMAVVFFFSMGEHIQIGMRNTLTLEYSKPEHGGLALGYQNSIMQVGNLLGYLAVIAIFGLGAGTGAGDGFGVGDGFGAGDVAKVGVSDLGARVSDLGSGVGDTVESSGVGLGAGAADLGAGVSDALEGASLFKAFFCAAAALMTFAMLASFRLTGRSQADANKRRFYFRRKFRKYYLLEMFYGARKQVFFTFGPYVLILFYGADAGVISLLFAISAVACFSLAPLVGRIIDRIGYKTVMIADTLLLVAVCFFYGFAHHIFPMHVAFIVCCVNYVLDSVISLASMASNVYVQDISDSPEEMRATISTGISVNHLITIFIALLGGWVWNILGIETLFILSAILGLCNSAYAATINRPSVR